MNAPEYGQELHGMAERNRGQIQELRSKLTALENLQVALDEAVSKYVDDAGRSESETGTGAVMTHAELRRYEDPRDAFLEMALRNGGVFHLRTAAAKIYEASPERRKRDSVRVILNRHVRNNVDWEDAGDGDWRVIGEAALAGHAPADANELDTGEEADVEGLALPDDSSDAVVSLIGPAVPENWRV